MQPEPMNQYKDTQICSMYACRMTTSKLSTFDGTKLYYQQVKYLPKWSWKDCTSQNCKILFSFRLSWLLYDQETVRNNGQPSYSRLKTSARLHFDQTMRTRNFRVRNEVVEREAVTKRQKGKKNCVERKWEYVFSGNHMDSVRKETHRVEKDDRPLPHQDRRPRLTAREKNPQKIQATEMKALNKRSKNPCRYRNWNNPSCNYWRPPECQNYKSKKGCTCGRKCFFRKVEAEEKPSKKSKKGGAKGAVASLKSSVTIGLCVSRSSPSEKVFST